MTFLSQFITAASVADSSAGSDFGGLGKEGLITVIFISVLLLVVFIWIMNGTRKRD